MSGPGAQPGPDQPVIGSNALEPFRVVGEQDRTGSSSDPDGCTNACGSIHKRGTKKMGQHNTCAAGIDTAKHKLDIAIMRVTDHWQVANESAGWRELERLLRQHRVRRVGIEATGGYERGVVRYLRKVGFFVLVIQPVQLRAYAKAMLRKAKNDRIDADLIALFTANWKDDRDPPDPRLAPWADILTVVEQTEQDIVRFKTRLEHVEDGRLRRLLLSDIERLKARRASLLARLSAELREHEDLRQRLNLVQSVPGIGARTALALIVRMPELGTMTREQAAAMAGLAPYDDDSGGRSGERHIAGGRKRVRRSLYMASLAASFRWNPPLKALYERLTAKGKKHNEALIACCRKLLIYANTVLTRGTPWVKATAPA
jgi:transposase